MPVYQSAEATQNAQIAANGALAAEAKALAQQANTRAMLPGPAGKDSTVAGPKGSDSVVPGPRGDIGPSGQVVQAVGHAVTGVIALGGFASYTITLSRPMPDTAYLVDFIRSTGLAVGKADLTVTAKTTTAVTVKVTATLALIGADLNVLAHY